MRKPAVALIGDSQPILRRLIDVLPAHSRARASRRDEMQERQAKLRARLAKLEPQLAYLDAIRAELPEDGIFVDEVTQVGFAARLALPVYKPRTFLSPAIRTTSAGASPPRSAPRTRDATCRCWRYPATAASSTQRASLPARCAIAFRWSPCCSTITPSAMSAASRKSATATG